MEIKTEIQSILLPVPLNSGIKVPLRKAVRFHETCGASVMVMHVVPELSIFHRILSPEKIQKHNQKALTKLTQKTQKFFGGKIPEYVQLKIVNGELIPAILKTAEDLSSDLIIIKKARRSERWWRFLRRENADVLISNAVCPVLTLMKKPSGDSIDSILIPVDITKKISGKVAWAISLGKKFNAKLHIVSILNLDIRHMDSLSYRKSKEIEMAIRQEGLEVHLELLKAGGKPMDEAVLDYANNLNPDMILLMTHQESILFDNYLGNFAREIVHKSTFPVFSIVPRKETIMGGFLEAAGSKINL